jgi:hypothetical protein
MEPYYPVIEAKMRGVFEPRGFEIVRYNHMRGKSPATFSVVTAKDMIEAVKAIDGPDIEAIVQCGDSEVRFLLSAGFASGLQNLSLTAINRLLVSLCPRSSCRVCQRMKRTSRAGH